MRLVIIAKIILLLLLTSLSYSASADTDIDNNNNTQNTPIQTDPADANLVKEIKTRMSDNRVLANTNITIRSVNGVVTLTGTVNIEAQLYEAINITRSVPGVRDIISDLTIAPNAGNQ